MHLLVPYWLSLYVLIIYHVCSVRLGKKAKPKPKIHTLQTNFGVVLQFLGNLQIPS